jgi:hypothetical protein
MKEQKEVLEAALKADRVTPELEALFRPMPAFDDDFDDEVDILQMMLETVGMEMEEKSRRFAEGDLVQFQPRKKGLYSVAPPKGAIASVEATWYDEEKDEHFYALQFSAEVLSAIKWVPDFWLGKYMEHAFIDVAESDLKPVRRRQAKNFDREAALAKGRELTYGYMFDKLKLPQSQQARLREMLFTEPAAPDYINLDHWYRESELTKDLHDLPVRLRANPFMRKGRKAIITHILGIDEDVGFIAKIKIKELETEIPLHYLSYDGKNRAIGQFFEDYALWAEHRVSEQDIW